MESGVVLVVGFAMVVGDGRIPPLLRASEGLVHACALSLKPLRRLDLPHSSDLSLTHFSDFFLLEEYIPCL